MLPTGALNSAPLPGFAAGGHGPNFWKAGDLITVKAYTIKDGRPVGALRGAITKEGVIYSDVEGLNCANRKLKI